MKPVKETRTSRNGKKSEETVLTTSRCEIVNLRGFWRGFWTLNLTVCRFYAARVEMNPVHANGAKYFATSLEGAPGCFGVD